MKTEKLKKKIDKAVKSLLRPFDVYVTDVDTFNGDIDFKIPNVDAGDVYVKIFNGCELGHEYIDTFNELADKAIKSRIERLKEEAEERHFDALDFDTFKRNHSAGRI